MKNIGLIDAHAYSLLAAKVVDDNGRNVRLVKVRNPWGKREWKGDWSDGDKKWTPHTKKQVEYVDANDGTFFISFEDYFTFFYITTICFQPEDGSSVHHSTMSD